MALKVLVPGMPPVDSVLPLLREIEASGVWVNQGPMVRRLEARAQEVTGVPAVAVSTGTAALELGLRAMGLPPGSEVAVPAVTFRATGLAVVAAGLTPVLFDVDPLTWQLDPVEVYAARSRRPRLRAAIPVAAFGAPVPLQPWHTLAREGVLQVLVDAAGALLDQDTVLDNGISFAYSLHATKFVGCGEGGLFCSGNRLMREAVEELATFGDDGSLGRARENGTNAKLSEVHAAFGIASLMPARLSAARKQAERVFGHYTEHLPPQVTMQRLTQPIIGRTLLPVALPSPVSAHAAGLVLSEQGIETRQWYRPFLDELPALRASRPDSLPVTWRLRQRMLGLPFHAGVTEDDVRTVCSALSALLPRVTVK